MSSQVMSVGGGRVRRASRVSPTYALVMTRRAVHQSGQSGYTNMYLVRTTFPHFTAPETPGIHTYDYDVVKPSGFL
jgi:hypothetical protein